MSKVLTVRPSCANVSPHEIKGRIDAMFYDVKYKSLDDELGNFSKSDVMTLGSLLKKPRRIIYQNTQTYSAKNAPAGAIPFVSGVDLDPATMSVNWDTVKYVDNWMLDKYPKGQLFNGALLIKVKGPNQHTIYVPNAPENALISGTILFAEVKGCNPYYLTAYLSAEPGISWRSRLRTNTTVEFIGNEELRQVPIYVPDPKIQDYIGAKVALAERCRAEAKDFESAMKLKVSTFVEGPGDIKLNKLTYWTDNFLTSDRLDSMYYQPAFIENKTYLLNRSDIFRLNDDECCELITDGDHGNPVYSENGPKYLRVTDFHGFNLQYKNMPSINPVYANKIGSRCTVKENDVIVSIVGTIGLITVINSKSEGAIASRGVARLVPNKSLNSYYLAAYLSSDRGQLQLKQLSVGTVQKGIYLESLKQLLVPIPPKEIQNKIGNDLKRYIWLTDYSSSLSEEAKSDVEALIEGTLDTDAILTGRLQAPTWDDIKQELEEVQS